MDSDTGSPNSGAFNLACGHESSSGFSSSKSSNSESSNLFENEQFTFDFDRFSLSDISTS
ncbi:hypothetical protein DPMN_127198 [Dreissena polymorpha]|uniref:Uncharacterized protein n=1 Tax=Dreissena polymorpha TaxID=45954 RepID=A0A9D4GXF4_DREPO|nr:hypothetical protein DPMN_127198 [Dreissena polymorpha]